MKQQQQHTHTHTHKRLRTNTQELYITPSLMTPEQWDDLAETIRWAHQPAVQVAGAWGCVFRVEAIQVLRIYSVRAVMRANMSISKRDSVRHFYGLNSFMVCDVAVRRAHLNML